MLLAPLPVCVAKPRKGSRRSDGFSSRTETLGRDVLDDKGRVRGALHAAHPGGPTDFQAHAPDGRSRPLDFVAGFRPGTIQRLSDQALPGPIARGPIRRDRRPWARMRTHERWTSMPFAPTPSAHPRRNPGATWREGVAVELTEFPLS